jgi:transposase InsO family protein
MRVGYQGSSWQVTELDGFQVKLANTNGQTEVLPFYQFVTLPSVQRLVEQRQQNVQAGTSLGEQLDAYFTTLSEPLKASALERLAHLREAMTGYRSGEASRSDDSEPRSCYDPNATTQKARFKTKATELRAAGVEVSARTLRFQRDEYQRRGLIALVDARQLRYKLPLGKHPDRVISAAKQVLAGATEKSTITKKLHIEAIQKLLKADMKAGTLTFQKGLPSYTTVSRLIDNLGKNLYIYASAKRRRSQAGRPQRLYQMLIATRVGEYVVLDASTYDVWGFDSITGEKVRHRLVVAIDVFSRCILSARFYEQDPNGIDAAFVLYDMIVPKLAPDNWPQEALLPYVGLPETLVIELHDLPDGAALKGIPFAQPDNLIVDNGKIFISDVFESACERLGISLIVARPYTGNDKSHVERFFETARDGFCMYLPGYTGNSPENKGKDPEKDAYYFRHELEDEFHLWLSRIYHTRPHDGLFSPDVPNVHFAPLDVFRDGMRASGYLHIPMDKNIYQQLLETKWRRIHAYGVDFYGLHYDAPEMMPLRNTTCPYSLKNGNWPFKVDRRDLRYIYFQHPDTGEWITLTRRNAKAIDAPFTSVHLELARTRVLEAGGKPKNRQQLNDALETLLDEQNGRVAQNRTQRQREIKELHQIEQAQKNQEQTARKAYVPQAMALPEPTPVAVDDAELLNITEGFGSVDELDDNVANVFTRGKSSYWNREKS